MRCRFVSMVRICLAAIIACGITAVWVHLSEQEQFGTQIR